jgi:hypothetical protein
MKTPASPIWIPGLVLAMAWLPGGLAQNETNRSPTFARDATPVTVPALAPRAPALHRLTTPTDVSSQVVIAPPDDTASKDKRLPSKIRLSPWTTEIVKLAESGIDDSVMLSFIDNSGTFNLSAAHIIYLNDLGVSSQTITAMLQHDQELISGVRALTIASEPAWEPPFEKTFAASSDASIKPSTLPAPKPPVAAPLTAELADTPNGKLLPEANRTVPDTQPAALQYAMAGELDPVKALAPSPQQLFDKKRNLYPVREPYAVELTAPIIFIVAANRTPNTLIIVGFPRTEPLAP